MSDVNMPIMDQKLECMARELLNFIETIKKNDGVFLYRSQSESKATVLDEPTIRNLIVEYYHNFALRSHPQVEFAIQDGDVEKVFPNLGEAVEWATKHSLREKAPVEVEVVIYGEEGVKWYKPEEEGSFEIDSDGFVYERIQISAKQS